MPISQKQLEEWCDAEVTRHFLKLVQERLDATFKIRAEAFFPYEPMKTQEAKAHLIGAEGAYQDVIDALIEADFSQLEEPDDEERIRNTPMPGSGAN
jgi:hypothetical protein